MYGSGKKDGSTRIWFVADKIKIIQLLISVCLSVVFWGGREGYQSLLNTDVKRELDHMAKFFRMAAGAHWHCNENN